MVRITKVHTGVGDGGMTRHLDGTEVAKSDARLELVGTIDELNCVVGLVRMELDRFSDVAADGGQNPRRPRDRSMKATRSPGVLVSSPQSPGISKRNR